MTVRPLLLRVVLHVGWAKVQAGWLLIKRLRREVGGAANRRVEFITRYEREGR